MITGGTDDTTVLTKRGTTPKAGCGLSGVSKRIDDWTKPMTQNWGAVGEGAGSDALQLVALMAGHVKGNETYENNDLPTIGWTM